MSVVDRNVIDITYTEDNKYILEIVDHLEWNFETRQEHGRILQDKINDYLDYIASGQAEKAKPGLRPVIRIIAQYSYSKYCIDFLERVKKFIKNKDDICDIEWTHDSKEKQFNDGFSDDYVFEPEKIYPRLRKNWAKNPLEEISLMATMENSPSYPDNLIMFRIMDSFIGVIMGDLGDHYTYFTYDMLSENMSPEKIQDIAFKNLSTNVQYRQCESKEKGIYGIVAGGNFEAESILFDGIWENISNNLNDDIVISIPTKDIVLLTKLSDDKLRNKMIKMARKTFERNQKESPYLIFCKDIFIYSRENKKISLSTDYKL